MTPATVRGKRGFAREARINRFATTDRDSRPRVNAVDDGIKIDAGVNCRIGHDATLF